MNESLKQYSLVLPANGDDRSLGNADARAVAVVYGDYEKAESAAAYRVLRDAQTRIGEDRLRLVYRHFPIGTSGSRGWRAAEAAEAAGGQNLFWEMHERLCANLDSLDDGSLVEYAVEIGANPERFLREMSGHQYAARVREDLESGTRSGVETVPAIFINNVRYEASGLDLDELIRALND